MKAKSKKRGVGRPRLKPMSGPEMREKALAGIRRTTERQLKRSEIDVPTFVEEVESITGKHKFTREAMDEIRRKVDMLYNEYVNQQWEAEAEATAPYVDVMRAAAIQQGEPTEGMMTRAQWFEEHGLRPNGKRKPGPTPKKKKTVFDIAPGERGTAEKPGEPLDCEGLEAELEAKLMEEYIKDQADQPQYPVGRRLRKDHLTPPRRASVRSFWI